MTSSVSQMVLESVIEKCDIHSPIRAIQVTIPSLSLDHPSSSDSKHSTTTTGTSSTNASMSSSINNKQKLAAETLAISLLSRPITVMKELEINTQSMSSVECTCTKLTIVDACTSTVNDVVCTLLQNVILSFATLVTSRIHAYAEFLHRHAMVLSCTSTSTSTVENEDTFSSSTSTSSSSSYCGHSDEDEDESSENSINDHKSIDTIPNDRVRCIINKIEAIVHAGDQLSVSTKSICFESCTTSNQCNDDFPESESGTVRLVLTIGLQLPTDGTSTTLQNTDSYYSLTVSAPGIIQATYDDTNEVLALCFNIDTKKLLHSMIQEASNVVSKANEVANSNHTIIPNCHEVSSSSCTSHGVLVTKHNIPNRTVPAVLQDCSIATVDHMATPRQEESSNEKSMDRDRCRLNRTASFLSMPPPPPKTPSCNKRNSDCMNMNTNMNMCRTAAVDENMYNTKRNQKPNSSIFCMGLDLLCEAAAVSESRIVTPDLKALQSSSHVAYAIPSLVLEDSIVGNDPLAVQLSGEDKGADTSSLLSCTDVSCLSPDQCADIIDTCLFETNSAFDFFLPPVQKRQKLSDDQGIFSEISSTSFQPISAT